MMKLFLLLILFILLFAEIRVACILLSAEPGVLVLPLISLYLILILLTIYRMVLVYNE